jgi:hypothetical protein
MRTIGRIAWLVVALVSTGFATARDGFDYYQPHVSVRISAAASSAAAGSRPTPVVSGTGCRRGIR